MQNFLFANLPFERGKILFSKGFSVYTDIRKLQDKAKTSYTLSTRRLRFGYEFRSGKIYLAYHRNVMTSEEVAGTED